MKTHLRTGFGAGFAAPVGRRLSVACRWLAALCVIGWGGLASGAPAETASPWTVSGSLSVKETYDDNVFLQDHGDQADRESWVFSVTPSLGLSYQAGPLFKAAASYAPEAAFYSSASSEDYVAHRGGLTFGGEADGMPWELANTVVVIDGDDQGPRFTGGGDIPAIGGVPLRDRRDAVVYRSGAKITRTAGNVFVRPVVSAYKHDFRTEQHAVTEPGFAGYENYIDRYDVSGGADGGYQVAPKTWLVLGYRYGHQDQGKNQLHAESPYDNNYQRFLIGIEGAPADWIKLSVLGGPDVRDFTSPTPAGFDEDELLYYVDASVSLMPTKDDTVTLAAKRFAQPAFASHSFYEDIVYDLAYKRKLDARFATAVGFKVYEGDWQAPVNREDWIFTPSASLVYTHDRRLSGEVAYSYDWVESRVPNTDGREFTRHLVSVGLKYTL